MKKANPTALAEAKKAMAACSYGAPVKITSVINHGHGVVTVAGRCLLCGCIRFSGASTLLGKVTVEAGGECRLKQMAAGAVLDGQIH